MKMLRTLPAAAVAVVLAGAGCRMKAPQEAAVPQAVAPGAEMIVPPPDVTSVFDLADYKGEVVLLDFWATWCAPCRSEIPSLNQLHAEFKNRDVEVWGLSVDRVSPVQLAASARKLGITYPVVLADARIQGQFGGIRVVPTKILVDRKGEIRKTFPGVVPPDELRRHITALLNE
ncbi:MAG: TlpA disulfide reductase family protein [bacterium]